MGNVASAGFAKTMAQSRPRQLATSFGQIRDFASQLERPRIKAWLFQQTIASLLTDLMQNLD